MKRISLSLTEEELGLLVSLAADQLFRREFIDPKMPGYRSNPGEVAFGKAMVNRLRLLLGQVPKGASANAAAAPAPALAGPAKRNNRAADVL
jgi:hypothetical protein